MTHAFTGALGLDGSGQLGLDGGICGHHLQQGHGVLADQLIVAQVSQGQQDIIDPRLQAGQYLPLQGSSAGREKTEFHIENAHTALRDQEALIVGCDISQCLRYKGSNGQRWKKGQQNGSTVFHRFASLL